MYNFKTGTWKVVNDYPFGSGSYIAMYDIVFIPESRSFLIIGGNDGSGVFVSHIAKFKDGVWHDVGRLNSGRNVNLCLVLFDSQLMKTLF